MFSCSHCDAQFPKWQGRCSECGKWGSVQESQKQKTAKTQYKGGAQAAPVLSLSQASKQTAKHLPTHITEFDRVLSGGLVAGSVTLLAGEPGIGKSTLVAQIANAFGETKSVYYVSGEESEGQVLMRMQRLGIHPASISFSNAVHIGSIIETAKKIKPSLLIIDSIQTMVADQIDNLPGTPTAVRAATAQLIGYAKESSTPILIIGQMTKDGSVAGPKTLEHLVDTVLTLEGDKQHTYRLLRSGKNRFGNTDEVGIFEMQEKGLIGVKNPSQRFLQERTQQPGSTITCIMEGTRPILVEVQALAEKSFFSNPIRRTSGVDSSRLQMLLAIIGRHAGISVSGFDVYVNIVGGMKIKTPSVDLAICAAIISSILEKTLQKGSMLFGELGLSGEVRSVPLAKKREKESKRLGFEHIFSSKNIKHLSEIKKHLS